MRLVFDVDSFPNEKSDSLMKHFWIRSLPMILMGCAATWVCAQDETAVPAPPAKATRAELRDKQYDVSLDARDIERILTRLKRASELSKQRMTDAAAAAESVSGAIDRGDATAVRQRADETAKMFQEIVQQLEALLAEETPQRIAAARNLAAQLTKAEQQFAQQAQMLGKLEGDAAGTSSRRRIGAPSSISIRAVASATAAPPMSFFISTMPADGLRSSPPESKQTPFPTSVTRGAAGSPQRRSISRGSRALARPTACTIG